VSKESLLRIIEEEWRYLPLEIITNEILSMSNRIKSCIEMEGGHTMY
jgi:hypothetical protein